MGWPRPKQWDWHNKKGDQSWPAMTFQYITSIRSPGSRLRSWNTQKFVDSLHAILVANPSPGVIVTLFKHRQTRWACRPPQASQRDSTHGARARNRNNDENNDHFFFSCLQASVSPPPSRERETKNLVRARSEANSPRTYVIASINKLQKTLFVKINLRSQSICAATQD